MKAHFVTFLSPGTFFHEETTQPIDSWDARKAVAMSHGVRERYGAKPFCFYFTTRGLGDKDLDSKEIKRSGRYYLGGRIMTAKQIEKEIPGSDILLANMRINNWKQVIMNDNSWRIFQPFEKDDTLL